MRIGLAILGSMVLASAGCGGARYEESEDDWSSSSTSGTSTPTSSAPGGVDAGIDSAVDAGDPVRDRAMALITRSCTPCHRHTSPADVMAVQTGVYLETDAEILAYTSTYTVGNTPTNLASLIGQRAQGYDLLVGRDMRTPMPPRSASYPPLSQDEARQISAWFDASHGIRR
jgi:hypothetical protein